MLGLQKSYGTQHNRQTGTFRLYRAERELPRRKTSLGTCRRRHTNGYNDTRALDALKASCAAPISMGRGETPVRLQLTTARFAFSVYILFLSHERGIFYYGTNK